MDDLTPSLQKLLHSAIAHEFPFRHVDARRIFVAAGRRRSWSGYGRTEEYVAEAWPISLRFQGMTYKYVIVLRPPFFAKMSIAQRLLHLFHELFHIEPRAANGIRELPSLVSRAHGNSRRIYNYFVGLFVDHYRARVPRVAYRFLEHRELWKRMPTMMVHTIRKKRERNEWHVHEVHLGKLLREEGESGHTPRVKPPSEGRSQRVARRISKHRRIPVSLLSGYYSLPYRK